MNKFFIILRGDDDELGLLMILVSSMGLVLPIVAVMIFYTYGDRSKAHA